ncbi:class I SAM-dependent methyltransferase [Sneathiella sp.]|uniref:class I SAM-dependent methyltransferase n=1 Tax=Sneathiella sp. TaxID=1964365 RepID=UPI003565A9F7
MVKGRGKRDRAVKRQYEKYPYPPRNPADEKNRLIEGSPSHLDEVNHYLFAGKRDFSGPFRALEAGGGTGDAAIMLAQHLADRGDQSHVLYLDLSAASRVVAEARAEVRGLTNIEFRTASLLDLPDMGLAHFDYIDCCGVLHHLEEPEKGLAALTGSLAEEGGMGLMVYATLGRTGVYPVQKALKALAGEDDPAQQVGLAKALLKDLPKTNWLTKNEMVGDHRLGENAALYDLLLHPRDRSYLVPEVEALLDEAGMELVSYIEPVRYRPEIYLKDKLLIKRAQGLGRSQQAALAENLSGALKTHTFYARKKDGTAAGSATFEPDMIPILKDRNPEVLAKACAAHSTLTVNFDGETMAVPVPAGTAEFIRLIDGRRSLQGIQSELSLPWQTFRSRYAPAYKMLNGLNLLWLKS